ncbi:MAG: TorF family putative porin [Rhodospirillaceae bacterium]
MKLMKTIAVLTAVMGATAPIGAMAEDAPAAPESYLPGTFTGNVALTSDYVFRGYSQSWNNPAIQGGMDWDTGAGFHFGFWGSSVSFKDVTAGTIETDLYGGYAGKLGDHFSYDAGFIYYWYPGAAKALNYDLWEVYGKGAYDFGPVAVNVGVNYSPDNFGATGTAVYYSAGLTVPITDKLSISGNLGYWDLEAPIANDWDWNIGAKLNVNNWFNVDARYYDTNIVGDCPLVGKKTCGAKGVVTLSRSF